MSGRFKSYVRGRCDKVFNPNRKFDNMPAPTVQPPGSARQKALKDFCILYGTPAALKVECEALGGRSVIIWIPKQATQVSGDDLLVDAHFCQRNELATK